jgi:hypothetical protein
MRFVMRTVALLAVLGCGEGGPSQTGEPTGPVVTTIVITGPKGPLQVGASFALTAEVRDQADAPMTGKTVVWSSADASIAAVSGDGILTAVGPGSASISASVEGKSGSATVTVAAPAVFAVTITPLATPVVAGQSTALAVVDGGSRSTRPRRSSPPWTPMASSRPGARARPP